MLATFMKITVTVMDHLCDHFFQCTWCDADAQMRHAELSALHQNRAKCGMPACQSDEAVLLNENTKNLY
jgi:hypothetical protein